MVVGVPRCLYLLHLSPHDGLDRYHLTTSEAVIQGCTVQK